MRHSKEEKRAKFLRHDPNYVDVNLDFYDRAVGEALLTSTVVSKLDVNVASMLESIGRHNFSAVQPLLSFVQTSQSLREVDMNMDNGESHLPHYDNLAVQIIRAASENNAITKFGVDPYCAEVQVAVASLIETSGSIENLTIALYSEVDTVEIGESFRNNNTLNTLELFVLCNPPGHARPIFDNFHHLACLKDLSIVMSADMVGASGLCRLLNTTRTLQCLSLDNIKFDENFYDMWDAIRANQTLEQLDFVGCTFCAEHGKRLVGGTGRGLQLSIWMCTFDGTTGGDVVADLVMSSNHTVEFYPLGDTHVEVAALFAKLGSTANTKIGELLSRLKLRWYSRADEEMLVILQTHLSPLLNLSHLTLTTDSNPSPILAAALVPALRQNGSLHRVVFGNVDDTAPTHPQAIRLIDAFGQRNERVPILLDEAGRDNDVFRQVPSLLEAVTPATRLAPHTLFTMALSQGMSIGPSWMSDRLRVARDP